MWNPDRREVLQLGLGGALALASGCGIRRAGSIVAPDELHDRGSPPDHHLIERLADPFCGEGRLERIVRSWITPEPDFFVLNHGRVPVFDEPARYAVEIFGHITTTRPLTLARLRSMPRTTVEATLVCAGNRRREHHAVQPIEDPVLWTGGAIGNARWTGVRLVDVLEEIGVKNDAAHVWLEGHDTGVDGRFGGSIPITRIYDRDAPPVLLAFEMNDRPLTPRHGFPVRAIVPGFIGARSVKWLARILVATRPSHNPFFLRNHHWRDGEGGIDQGPIYELRTNAVICTPASGLALRGPVTVSGYAIAGDPRATITRVEVSTDGGRRWRPAALGKNVSPSCWRGGYLYDGWSMIDLT
ncbi:MAG: molybdopterin-dependent oxidoreductase [Deltaproteobacteria bacterium]|nr:molybdopterin-dependent oxidoreductase [Kofleriaceae bacterium]